MVVQANLEVVVQETVDLLLSPQAMSHRAAIPPSISLSAIRAHHATATSTHKRLTTTDSGSLRLSLPPPRSPFHMLRSPEFHTDSLSAFPSWLSSTSSFARDVEGEGESVLPSLSAGGVSHRARRAS